MTTSQMLIPKAIEAFVGGFTFTRSITHSYLGERIGPLWVMRDAPRKRPKYRNEEWVALDTAPKEVDRIARKHTRGRFVICHICPGDGAAPKIRAEYKAMKYRLGTTEPFMVHSLKYIPTFDSPAAIERVTSKERAVQFSKSTPRPQRPLDPKFFSDDSPLRQYLALVNDEIVGWVRSVVVGKMTWCASMYVKPKFRRKGIGKSLLSRMLKDDRKHGSQVAVLLASHTGAMLYPLLGYEQIATLLLYTPQKSK